MHSWMAEIRGRGTSNVGQSRLRPAPPICPAVHIPENHQENMVFHDKKSKILFRP